MSVLSDPQVVGLAPGSRAAGKTGDALRRVGFQERSFAATSGAPGGPGGISVIGDVFGALPGTLTVTPSAEIEMGRLGIAVTESPVGLLRFGRVGNLAAVHPGGTTIPTTGAVIADLEDGAEVQGDSGQILQARRWSVADGHSFFAAYDYGDPRPVGPTVRMSKFSRMIAADLDSVTPATLTAQLLSSTTSSFTATGAGDAERYPVGGGQVRIGDELIGYASKTGSGPWTFNTLTRGVTARWTGITPTAKQHEVGEEVIGMNAGTMLTTSNHSVLHIGHQGNPSSRGPNNPQLIGIQIDTQQFGYADPAFPNTSGGSPDSLPISTRARVSGAANGLAIGSYFVAKRDNLTNPTVAGSPLYGSDAHGHPGLCMVELRMWNDDPADMPAWGNEAGGGDDDKHMGMGILMSCSPHNALLPTTRYIATDNPFPNGILNNGIGYLIGAKAITRGSAVVDTTLLDTSTGPLVVTPNAGDTNYHTTAQGGGLLYINGEVIKYTTKQLDTPTAGKTTFTGLTRGMWGTQVQTHTGGIGRPAPATTISSFEVGWGVGNAMGIGVWGSSFRDNGRARVSLDVRGDHEYALRVAQTTKGDPVIHQYMGVSGAGVVAGGAVMPVDGAGLILPGSRTGLSDATGWALGLDGAIEVFRPTASGSTFRTWVGTEAQPRFRYTFSTNSLDFGDGTTVDVGFKRSTDGQGMYLWDGGADTTGRALTLRRMTEPVTIPTPSGSKVRIYAALGSDGLSTVKFTDNLGNVTDLKNTGALAFPMILGTLVGEEPTATVSSGTSVASPTTFTVTATAALSAFRPTGRFKVGDSRIWYASITGSTFNGCVLMSGTPGVLSGTITQDVAAIEDLEDGSMAGNDGVRGWAYGASGLPIPTPRRWVMQDGRAAAMVGDSGDPRPYGPSVHLGRLSRLSAAIHNNGSMLTTWDNAVLSLYHEGRIAAGEDTPQIVGLHTECKQLGYADAGVASASPDASPLSSRAVVSGDATGIAIGGYLVARREQVNAGKYPGLVGLELRNWNDHSDDFELWDGKGAGTVTAGHQPSIGLLMSCTPDNVVLPAGRLTATGNPDPYGMQSLGVAWILGGNAVLRGAGTANGAILDTHTTTISLNSAGGVYSTSGGFLQVSTTGEIIRYTGKTGSGPYTFTGISRGYWGTTVAPSISSGTVVYAVNIGKYEVGWGLGSQNGGGVWGSTIRDCGYSDVVLDIQGFHRSAMRIMELATGEKVFGISGIGTIGAGVAAGSLPGAPQDAAGIVATGSRQFLSSVRGWATGVDGEMGFYRDTLSGQTLRMWLGTEANPRFQYVWTNNSLQWGVGATTAPNVGLQLSSDGEALELTDATLTNLDGRGLDLRVVTSGSGVPPAPQGSRARLHATTGVDGISTIKFIRPNGTIRDMGGIKAYEGSFAIDSTGVKTITIAHGWSVTPDVKECMVCIQESASNVDDWSYDLLKVDSTDATNVTIKVRVSTASATASATAEVTLWMVDLP